MIRERLTKINNNNTRVEAVFTNPSRSKNIMMAIINPEVKIIENTGVPRLDTFPKRPGNNSSLLIAIGVLEAASRPALAVVANAKSAATPSIILPPLPMSVLAPKEIGVREFFS